MEIKRLLTTPPEEETVELLTDYFERYAAGRRTENSRAACHYTLKVIRTFGGHDILFEVVNVSWLKALDAHLAGQGVAVNTREIHFRNLRAVFNSAIDEDIVGLDAYPFRKFKIPSFRK